MFIETHTDTLEKITDRNKEPVAVAFVKSTDISAYPCGRRRSTQNSSNIPFDPEARLNTEANNRKHSSLNGFTQTYIEKWDAGNKRLTLAIAGYLFDIILEDSNYAYFASSIFDSIVNHIANSRGIKDTRRDELLHILSQSQESTTLDENEKAFIIEADNIYNKSYKIYANILIEDAQLFAGSQNYSTSILAAQSSSTDGLTSLDLLVSGDAESIDPSDPKHYYFSGLSFTTVPLSDYVPRNGTQWISLQLLERATADSLWSIHQQSYLPKIEHGATEGSIVIPGEALLKSNIEVEGTIFARTTKKDGDFNLNVKKARADSLEVTSSTITNTLTVQGDTSLNNLIIATGKSIVVQDNSESGGSTPTTPTVISNTIESTDITATSALYQKSGSDIMQVPIIELEKDDNGYYQLKISRIGEKS